MNPAEFAITDISPNPFNSQTVIRYDLPVEGKVSVQIFDLNGREITRLRNGIQAAGSHQVIWDAEAHPAGVYFLNLSANGQSNTKKVMLVR